MFSIFFPWYTVMLLGLLLFAVITAIAYGLKPLRRSASFENTPVPDDPGKFPKASLIVYSQNDEETLLRFLEEVSRQDYPDFEVIVVCETTSSAAEILSEKVGMLYSNVYITFIPPESHNLSRRKLAITVGIKAAKGEVVVTTVANVSIPSEKWLSSLLAPFAAQGGSAIDVSLGLSEFDFVELRGAARWYRQFDTQLTDANWIGYAVCGSPYRGDGNNLAFRRSVFFAHKGYARTINLHNGDDDLFIDEIANGDNTRVVVGEDSILSTHWGEAANRVWSFRKEGYMFTSRWLPKSPFFRAGYMSAMQWTALLSAVGASLLSLPSLIPAIASLLLLILLWGCEISAYRKCSARFGTVRLWWAVVPFWLWRPIGNLLFKIDHYSTRKKNFTWQRI